MGLPPDIISAIRDVVPIGPLLIALMIVSLFSVFSSCKISRSSASNLGKLESRLSKLYLMTSNKQVKRIDPDNAVNDPLQLPSSVNVYFLWTLLFSTSCNNKNYKIIKKSHLLVRNFYILSRAATIYKFNILYDIIATVALFLIDPSSISSSSIDNDPSRIVLISRVLILAIPVIYALIIHYLGNAISDRIKDVEAINTQDDDLGIPCDLPSIMIS